jgi:hypothetical protein
MRDRTGLLLAVEDRCSGVVQDETGERAEDELQRGMSRDDDRRWKQVLG